MTSIRCPREFWMHNGVNDFEHLLHSASNPVVKLFEKEIDHVDQARSNRNAFWL